MDKGRIILYQTLIEQKVTLKIEPTSQKINKWYIQDSFNINFFRELEISLINDGNYW